MAYSSPLPRRPLLKRPPEKDDPFHAYQESEQYSDQDIDLEAVPPPDPSCYTIFRDQRGKANLPKGAFQREIPKITIDAKVEPQKTKKTGLERKL